MGLLRFPVRLFAAARRERVSFNQIHRVCGSRIKQQTFCPHCERVIERSELVKGYEVEKDRYVIVNDEEIKQLAPASSDNMEILEFVKAEGIDPDLLRCLVLHGAGGGRQEGLSPAVRDHAEIGLQRDRENRHASAGVHSGSAAACGWTCCCTPCSIRRRCAKYRNSGGMRT